MRRALSRFPDRLLLYRSDVGRCTDEDSGPAVPTARAHAINKVLQHRFRNFEVGDDPVPQRADRRNVAGSAPDHAPCFLTDGKDSFGVGLNSDNGRFV